MTYNGWKMMDKIDVAIKDAEKNRWTFTGYVVEHGDKNALASAKSWAEIRNYSKNYGEDGYVTEGIVKTFDNSDFTVKILKSASGSSQGGRVSFLACEVSKGEDKFVIGVNDALLVDLIRNSTIINGEIQEKVMFVRKGGAPGFIHENMDAYKEAMADKKQKEDLKKAKKTSKWEIGGVYSTLTQKSVCIGMVWDKLETYTEIERSYSYWGGERRVTKFKEREEPVQVYAWIDIYKWRPQDMTETLTEFLENELKRDYNHYFTAGKPPARSKSHQYEVTKEDLKLIDKMLSTQKEYNYDYNNDVKIYGRYTRNIE